MIFRTKSVCLRRITARSEKKLVACANDLLYREGKLRRQYNLVSPDEMLFDFDDEQPISSKVTVVATLL